jgi:UPF0755 protein
LSERRRRLVALVAILLTATSVAAGYAVLLLHRPLAPDSSAQRFRVAAGDPFATIRAHLVAARLVSPRAPLALWARVSGRDRHVRAGTYELSASRSPLEILRAFVAGEVLQIRITVPEGLTCEQSYALLAEPLGVSIDSLRAVAANAAWLDSLGLPRTGLEGYLFPETYLFEPGTSARAVLRIPVATCLAHLDAVRRARAAELGLSMHAALTLASIIEAESPDSLERRRISAVYHNRLRMGWRLEADPTVAYALGRPGEPLTHVGLAIESPYNTYRRPGLPPGPICNPGLVSLDAALWPLDGCQDLFFVARGDGTHAFSRTLAEHNGWVRAQRRRSAAAGS